MIKRTFGFSKDLLKDLSGFPPKHFKQVISKALSLVNEPMPSDAKALQVYENLYRVDSGEYRIVYTFTEVSVDIIIIGKRNDDEVYRLLDRKMKN
jgi:mRNA interferase RelE/StbE